MYDLLGSTTEQKLCTILESWLENLQPTNGPFHYEMVKGDKHVHIIQYPILQRQMQVPNVIRDSYKIWEIQNYHYYSRVKEREM